MQHRRLGKTGYQVSEIGLGCWQLGNSFGAIDDATAEAILEKALAVGVDFWDTANVYGDGQSERRIAPKLRQHPEVKVATKVGRGAGLFPDNYSREGVKASLAGSAERLGVETIDLAQLHCVPTPVLEDGAIFGWLDDLVGEGLIRHWGASLIASVRTGSANRQASSAAMSAPNACRTWRGRPIAACRSCAPMTAGAGASTRSSFILPGTS